MKLSPMPATLVLDQYFLEARSKLLDLAAIMDRVQRGDGGTDLKDPRLERIAAALRVIGDPTADRAARVQELFSLPYDSEWVRPLPKKT